MDNRLIDKTISMRKKILDEANKKSSWILEKAEEEQRRIMEQTNKSIEGVIGSELRAVHDRIVGRAQLEGRRMLLDARMEILQKVRGEAYEQIKLIASEKHPDYNYSEFLIKLILEADEGIMENEYIVSANKKDLKYLEKNISLIQKTLEGKNIRVKETPVEILGGVIVSNAKETKIMENTLEKRLEASNTQLQTEIAEKLGVI